jgi:hypothetical protein
MLPAGKQVDIDDEFERFNGGIWHTLKSIINFY